MQFEENIKLIHGDRGADWLKNLPNLINKLTHKWNLSNLIPYHDLTYNYILKGTQGQKHIVLKLGFDIANIKKELEALIAFKNHGAVKIIDEDQISGAILLEEATPGNTLISFFPTGDIKALEIACKLADSLHKVPIPKNHSFTPLSSWLEIIDKDWELPRHILVLARELKNQLLKESESQVLLHGDLHYGNIISHKDSWIAIDPAGVIGDPYLISLVFYYASL